MTLNLAQLKKMEPTLLKLSNYNLPIEISYKISRLLRELTLFEEIRKDLIMKYGEEIDGSYRVREENMSKFVEEITPILTEFVSTEFEPIKKEDFPKDICLTPIQLLDLEDLII